MLTRAGHQGCLAIPPPTPRAVDSMNCDNNTGITDRFYLADGGITDAPTPAPTPPSDDDDDDGYISDTPHPSPTPSHRYNWWRRALRLSRPLAPPAPPPLLPPRLRLIPGWVACEPRPRGPGAGAGGGEEEEEERARAWVAGEVGRSGFVGGEE